MVVHSEMGKRMSYSPATETCTKDHKYRSVLDAETGIDVQEGESENGNLIDPERIVSIDESSFYFDMIPSRGYCHRSSRLSIPAEGLLLL